MVSELENEEKRMLFHPLVIAGLLSVQPCLTASSLASRSDKGCLLFTIFNLKVGSLLFDCQLDDV